MPAQHIRGKRGGNLILYNGFIYKKKQTKGVKDYYRCTHYGCNVTLHTQTNTLDVVHYNGNGQQQHLRSEDLTVSNALIDEMKI